MSTPSSADLPLRAPNKGRHIPPPLTIESSSYQSTSSIGSARRLSRRDSDTLLYDIPSSFSPPPVSPPAKHLQSPTSPNSRRSRSPRQPRPTPPPAVPKRRNRSLTPAGLSSDDLEAFAEACRSWYFDQDEAAGRTMTQTLANLPPSQRAPYSKLQANMRSAYHRSVNARKNAEFRAHLTATQPGGSLMPHTRANPRGKDAKKERYDRFARFIRSWCTLGMPGTTPFFTALWAIMRLQVVSEQLGGAGANRIDWELDDAVFKESAGKDFMLEAIDVLKGVLGFEEAPAASTREPSPTPPTSGAHSRVHSQPLLGGERRPTRPPAIPKRPRAPSDPFLDTPPPLSRSVGTSASQSSALLSQDSEDSPGPATPEPEETAPPRTDDFFDLPEEEYLRVWTSPDLPDAEYLALLKLFPTFITRPTLPRFPTRRGSLDLEAGEGNGSQRAKRYLFRQFLRRGLHPENADPPSLLYETQFFSRDSWTASSKAQMLPLSLAVLLLLTACVLGQQSQEAFTPIWVPLVVRTPHLNAWFWNSSASSYEWPYFGIDDGKILGWSGLVKVDGTTYNFLGKVPDVNGTVVTSSRLTPTRTIVTSRVENTVQLNVTYFSPIEPEDLVLQSLPFAYMSVSVSSLDGNPHNVSLYSDISGEWLSAHTFNKIVWNTTHEDAFTYHTSWREDPEPLVENSGVAEDSTLYFGMAASSMSVSWRTDSDVNSRITFQNYSDLGNSANLTYRPIQNPNDWPIFAIAYDLGTVTDESLEVVWGIGVARNRIAQAQTGSSPQEDRYPYYLTHYGSSSESFEDFLLSYDNASARADALDRKIMSAALNKSAEYADLIALGTRQVLAACEFTISKGADGYNVSDVQAFMKDSGTSQGVNDVMVMYSAWPAILFINASWAGYLLEPLLRYEGLSAYSSNVAAQDMGSKYPVVLGNMPPTTAYSYSIEVYPIQITAEGDDGLNHVNLALKGIMGVQAMSLISAALGKDDDASLYANHAASLVDQWSAAALQGGHVDYIYNDPYTTGLLYNLFADKLLKTAMVPDNIYQNQTNYYSSILGEDVGWGLPYNGSSETVIRPDLTLLTAAAMSDTQTRDAFVQSIWNRAANNSLVGGGCFPTSYDRYNGAMITGSGNPSLGAIYSLLALDLQNKTIVVPPEKSVASAHKSHIGSIVGGVIGGLVGLALLTGALFFFVRRRRAARSTAANATARNSSNIEPWRPSTDRPVMSERHNSGQSSGLMSVSKRGSGVAEARRSLTRSDAETSRDGTALLRGELDNLRQEVEELRGRREYDLPPPEYEHAVEH
ncbi:hypothetical protein EV715DRAFT_274277 [Schizophyllum commune]